MGDERLDFVSRMGDKWVMSSTELREKLRAWMAKYEKSAVDVASIKKVDPKTVKRFLDGGNARPVVLAAFEDLVKTVPSRASTEAATG